MDWKNRYRKNKGKLLVVGASALVLALIVFSGVCLGTLRLCGLWSAASTWGFWECFGALSVVVIFFLVARFVRKHRPSPTNLPATNVAVTSAPATSFSGANLLGTNLSGTNPQVAIPSATEPDPPHARSDWRELYNQLSRDEQKAFKATIAKFLGSRPSEGTEEGG